MDEIRKLFVSVCLFLVVGICNAQQKFVVVIDPGHGGKDTGALGPSNIGVNEKDIALDVSLLLGKYISTVPGVKVIYTRSTDVFVELQKRSQIANRNKADLFVSIHCNANDDPLAHGTESYVIGLSKNKESLEVAKRENSVIELEDNYKKKYKGFDPNSIESLVGLTLSQDKYLENSLLFSRYVQQQFQYNVGRRNRGVKQGPWWVISHNTMPSVLVELGFLTNKEEGYFLKSSKGKKYMARAMFKAFEKYKEDVDKKKEKILNQRVAGSVEYKVQFFSSVKKVNKSKFRGLENLGYYKYKNVYRYTCCNAKDYKQIVQKAQKIRKKYKGAFVVSFKNGKRVPLKSIKNR